jgi:hypothetical protein
MHDISNNLVPTNISNLFVLSKGIHEHKTRFSLLNNYQVKYSRLTKLNKSFAKTGVTIWNSLPLNLRNLPKNRFKKDLSASLFTILTKEGYVDVSILIKLIKNI